MSSQTIKSTFMKSMKMSLKISKESFVFLFSVYSELSKYANCHK